MTNNLVSIAMEYARVLLILVSCAVVGSSRRLLWGIDDEGCRTPDYGVGTCVKINECTILTDFIERSDNLSDDIKSEIRRYACGVAGNSIKVCCPSKLPTSWTQNKFGDKKESSDHSQHPSVKLLPESGCGTASPLNRIVNGNITDLFEFPWAAVLKYERDINQFSCGASLISKRYVLTAAHCVRSKYKLISVRLGEYNFSEPIDCITGLDNDKICAEPPQDFDISVDDAIVHPEYDANRLVNDIALIRLRKDATINLDSVNPICLPLSKDEKSKDHQNFTVIGWGATETGFASNVLLKVLVPKVVNSECAPQYASRYQISDNQLCAGGKREQDSCAGDSGGPLSAEYIPPDSSFRTIQYGIVSFGPRICGRENFPAVYTRVDKYVGWILDNMKP